MLVLRKLHAKAEDTPEHRAYITSKHRQMAAWIFGGGGGCGGGGGNNNNNNNNNNNVLDV